VIVWDGNGPLIKGIMLLLLMHASDPKDPKGPFLYSTPVNAPRIENTDFFFGVSR